MIFLINLQNSIVCIVSMTWKKLLDQGHPSTRRGPMLFMNKVGCLWQLASPRFGSFQTTVWSFLGEFTWTLTPQIFSYLGNSQINFNSKQHITHAKRPQRVLRHNFRTSWMFDPNLRNFLLISLQTILGLQTSIYKFQALFLLNSF